MNVSYTSLPTSSMKTSKKTTSMRRRRSTLKVRGGDCGCNKMSKLFSGGRRKRRGGSSDPSRETINARALPKVGGKLLLRKTRRRLGGIGGWTDPLLGKSFYSNPVTGFGSSANVPSAVKNMSGMPIPEPGPEAGGFGRPSNGISPKI